MNDLRQRPYCSALLALLLVFAACKGESPTAPPVGSPGPGTPPTGASIALAVANPNPNTDSSTAITATVTVNGQPVPAGTAVEFGTTLGRFEDTGTNRTLRVTNAQGQATVSLTSSSAGTATVTAVVNNVSERTTVTFAAVSTPPPQTPTAPTISGMNPTVGRVDGGELVTITGTNFREPVRVFFTVDGQLVPGQVVSVTPTQIQVLTPRINLAAGQTIESTVVVFVEQGTPNEVRLTTPTPFTFRRAQLTPQVNGISPSSGPLEGGTQTTIFGDGFEPFVQVFFGLAEAQVVNVTFNSIVVVAPNSRDTTEDATPVAGVVPVRVRNVTSGTETVFNGFRYHATMQITTISPLTGSALGGTDVTIDGIGFDDPLQVFIGGVEARVLRVSGTQILARTGALANPCGDNSGPISIMNTSTGVAAESDLIFQYIGVDPFITSVSSTGPITPGSTIAVAVQNPGVGPLGTAVVRFEINGQPVTPTPNVITNGLGTQTFTVTVPLTGFTFPTRTCTTAAGTAGTQLGPIDVDLNFTNLTTNCNVTLDNGVRVEPPGPNTCLAPPTATVSPTGVPPDCAIAPDVVAAGATTTSTTITISNAPSAQDLVITGGTITGTNGTYTIAPQTATVPAGGNQVFTVTIDPECPVAPCTANGTARFNTNDPNRTAISVCVTTTGTP